jgi:hypothetical protein
MKLSKIIFTGISLLITPTTGQDYAGVAYWLDDYNNVADLYVTGGCISFGGRAADMALIFAGYRCRFYR